MTPRNKGLGMPGSPFAELTQFGKTTKTIVVVGLGGGPVCSTTKDWRANHDAARPGSTPAVEQSRPDPPKAYFLPKAVLERKPDEQLSSEQVAPE